MRGPFILGGLALVLVSALVIVMQKEAVLARGQPVLLRLAPVDPRSLMQGDYMRLNYAISTDQGWDNDGRPRDGNLVLRLDSDGVGQFVRFDSAEVPLAPGEFRLRYRIRDHRVRLGAEAFFFQEGHADRYEHAKYGELRVADSGTSVLVGLRDENRKPLGDAVH
ncbi:GDYXXLXY domain-containing protein [Myxococcaceae bacterium JPH2]|nr:GDYXXLXY domain-containing protein [Myxococcaceae bacterium JPH2]